MSSPTCHPERPYYAVGECKKCYQARYYRQHVIFFRYPATCHPERNNVGGGLCGRCYYAQLENKGMVREGVVPHS